MVFAQVCLMVIERLKWLNWRKIHSCVCACISWKIDLPAHRANTPEIFWWEHFEFNGRFYFQRLKYFVLVFFLLNSYISYQFVLWILLQDERDDRSNILQCSLWSHSVENEERSFFHSQNAREIGGRLRSKFQPKTLFNYNKIRKYLFTCIHFILSLSRSLVFFSFYVLPPHLSQSWDKSTKMSKSNKEIFLLFHLECNAK